jgi:lipoprotein-anchoring transpeptidase ErfK/SrfK
MKRSPLFVLARCVAALGLLGVLLTAVLVVPPTAPAGDASATLGALSTESIPPTTTPDTSTVPATGTPPATATVPATVTPKPKPKVDKRPKAPKFVTKKGKAIYLDRRHQWVYLYVDGRQIDKFRCSTSSTLPRRGTYHIYRKRRQSWSFNFAVTFYYQSIFTVGPHGNNIAFHSVPVNHAGHEIAPLGKPVSHGCVRVKYKKAKFIYYWATKRTPIYVRP